MKIIPRNGMCQPQDNLGISCLIKTEEKSYSGRKKLSLPPDNIGISCLPISHNNGSSDISEDIAKKQSETQVKNKPSKHREIVLAKEANVDISKKSKTNNKIIETGREDTMGISNIRRPRYDPTKPRKPIMPRDNWTPTYHYAENPHNRLDLPKMNRAYNVRKYSNEQTTTTSSKAKRNSDHVNVLKSERRGERKINPPKNQSTQKKNDV